MEALRSFTSEGIPDGCGPSFAGRSAGVEALRIKEPREAGVGATIGSGLRIVGCVALSVSWTEADMADCLRLSSVPIEPSSDDGSKP